MSYTPLARLDCGIRGAALFWPPLERKNSSAPLAVYQWSVGEPVVQSYGPGSTEPSAARGPCTSARGIINATTSGCASARGIATASACTGARGRDNTTASACTSTRGGHDEAASTGTSTARHAADAASTNNAVFGRLLGNG